MKEMSLSEFRRLTVQESKDVLPLILTAEGTPFAVIGKIDELIILSDLHIRVQNQLRALEQKVRLSMPAPVKIFADEVK